MDNILVYSHTLSDRQRIICQVLSTLQEQRLFLKPEKCKFEQKEVEYLGLVILKDHVTMDPTKVCRVTVMEWLTPMKVKEVQSFLGFVNFYWKFICDFSNITHPLYALTCKTQQWVWGLAKQEAFDALKRAVTSTLSVMPQTLQPEQSSPKHNYQIHNKEMLAIMRMLDEWHHFLEGAAEKFEILTDHWNLTYFCDTQKLNHQQAHWSLFLLRFNFSLCHQPGQLMGRPDMLSWRSDYYTRFPWVWARPIRAGRHQVSH